MILRQAASSLLSQDCASSSDSLDWLAVRIAMVDCDFTVREPRELADYMRKLGARLSRAGGGPEAGGV